MLQDSPQFPGPLDPQRVDVWCLLEDDIDDVRDAHLLRAYRELMSETELEREQRIRFAVGKRRFLLTRALVRIVLSKYAEIAPKAWQFVANSQGKPQIDNDDAVAARLRFNVSHTDSLIVLAVTADAAVGIDTENIQSRDAPLDAGYRFFSASESAALASLPEAMQARRFFEYWTLKEAYLKARGSGLFTPLNQFGIEFLDQGRLRLSMDAALQDTSDAWRLQQSTVFNDYLLALCVQRGPTTLPQSITFSKIIPTLSEERMSVAAKYDTAL